MYCQNFTSDAYTVDLYTPDIKMQFGWTAVEETTETPSHLHLFLFMYSFCTELNTYDLDLSI